MNEHLNEHFMYSFMNTFLREMHTLHTSWVYNPLINKKRELRKYVREYVRKVCKVFINRSKVFIKVFIKYSCYCSQEVL